MFVLQGNVFPVNVHLIGGQFSWWEQVLHLNSVQIFLLGFCVRFLRLGEWFSSVVLFGSLRMGADVLGPSSVGKSH